MSKFTRRGNTGAELGLAVAVAGYNVIILVFTMVQHNHNYTHSTYPKCTTGYLQLYHKLSTTVPQASYY